MHMGNANSNFTFFLFRCIAIIENITATKLKLIETVVKLKLKKLKSIIRPMFKLE